MSLDAVCQGPAAITLDRVVLPQGFSLVGTVPALRAPVRLGFADRGSSAALVLKQTSPLREGARHTVRVRERVVRPARLARWPTRWAEFDLVRDTTPPTIQLGRVTVEPARTTVEASFEDTCAGLADLELVVRRQAEETVVSAEVLTTRSDYSVGFNAAHGRFVLEGALPAGVAVMLRARDAVVNAVELDIDFARGLMPKGSGCAATVLPA